MRPSGQHKEAGREQTAPPQEINGFRLCGISWDKGENGDDKDFADSNWHLYHYCGFDNWLSPSSVHIES
jgi:hypothetical protein